MSSNAMAFFLSIISIITIFKSPQSPVIYWLRADHLTNPLGGIALGSCAFAVKGSAVMRGHSTHTDPPATSLPPHVTGQNILSFFASRKSDLHAFFVIPIPLVEGYGFRPCTTHHSSTRNLRGT